MQQGSIQADPPAITVFPFFGQPKPTASPPKIKFSTTSTWQSHGKALSRLETCVAGLP